MSRPVKVETTVRAYDAEGKLLSEQTTVTEVTPQPEPDITGIGLYL